MVPKSIPIAGVFFFSSVAILVLLRLQREVSGRVIYSPLSDRPRVHRVQWPLVLELSTDTVGPRQPWQRCGVGAGLRIEMLVQSQTQNDMTDSK